MSMKTKKERYVTYRSWCGKRGSNPYGKTTRPSNVRVCLFRHSRDNVTDYTRKIAVCQYLLLKKGANFYPFLFVFYYFGEKESMCEPEFHYFLLDAGFGYERAEFHFEPALLIEGPESLVNGGGGRLQE